MGQASKNVQSVTQMFVLCGRTRVAEGRSFYAERLRDNPPETLADKKQIYWMRWPASSWTSASGTLIKPNRCSAELRAKVRHQLRCCTKTKQNKHNLLCCAWTGAVTHNTHERKQQPSCFNDNPGSISALKKASNFPPPSFDCCRQLTAAPHSLTWQTPSSCRFVAK